MAIAPEAPPIIWFRQLRHDLLNALNVLIGATGALKRSTLDDQQQTWVRMIDSTSVRLQDIVDNLESYRRQPELDGQARLADLCSIAAGRVGKPFDRARLIAAINRITGMQHQTRVLLVDDSPELATLVKTYLNDSRWDVDVVETGERAVAQATTERYDVVLMDIDLPGVDGATAAHAIRAADLARGTSPTPIVAMTAFDPMTSVSGPAEDGSSADVVRINDPEIAALVPEFIEHRKDEVTMYRDALADGEFGRIQSAAHKMKGTGWGYGLAEISRIGGELELAAHGRDVATMARLIDELDAYLRRVRIES